jgi:hypothetical protein
VNKAENRMKLGFLDLGKEESFIFPKTERRKRPKRGQGKFWNFWSVAAASAPPLFLQDT